MTAFGKRKQSRDSLPLSSALRGASANLEMIRNGTCNEYWHFAEWLTGWIDGRGWRCDWKTVVMTNEMISIKAWVASSLNLIRSSGRGRCCITIETSCTLCNLQFDRLVRFLLGLWQRRSGCSVFLPSLLSRLFVREDSEELAVKKARLKLV